MRIGDLAANCDCPAETIRYYERVGLLPPVQRTPNGYRHYTDGHRKWLLLILRCRDMGFSQAQVRRLTELAGQEPVDCSRVRRVVVEHLAEVESKMRELKKMEAALRRLADKCGQQFLPRDCPVIDELMDE